LIHRTFAAQTYNLQSKLCFLSTLPKLLTQVAHPSTPTALSRFNVIFRRHYVMQKNSNCIETD